MTWLDDLLDEGITRPLTQGEVRKEAGADPYLEALCAGLPRADTLLLREERAAILEHLAGLSRAEAECRAGLQERAQSPNDGNPHGHAA